MKLLKSKNFRTRLTMWFLLLALTPMLIALVIIYFQRLNTIQSNEFKKITAIRDLKVGQIQNWIAERKGNMKTISANLEVDKLESIINKKTYNKNDIEIITKTRILLKNYYKNHNSYSEIFIINSKTGKILVSTNKSLEGDNKSDKNYFTEPIQTQKLFISNIYYSRTMSCPTMTFSIPLFDNKQKEKNILGILVARVNLNNTLYKLLLDRVGLGETGETLIVDKKGFALNKLRWYDNAPLNLKITSYPALNSDQGKTGIVITKDYRNKDIIASYTYIPETHWGFVCKQDLSEVNAPINKTLKNFIILFIGTLFIILVLTYFISQTITKPILNLNNVVKKMKSGDYSARNIVESDDELGFLANSTNEMAAVIESQILIEKSVKNISQALIGKNTMNDFSLTLLKQLMEITNANMSTFYILNETTSEFEHYNSVGANKELLKPFNAKNPEGEFSKMVEKKEITYIKNIPADTIFKFKTTAGDAIPKEIITLPVLIDNEVVAVISLVNINKFKDETFEVIKQSWQSINNSYSALLSNERTKILAENLSESNQQLEAQAEELQQQTEELQEQTEELQRSSEELEQQNIELEQQSKQLEEANRLKSEFLANMSHELRTPLNSINALSQVLIMQAQNKLSDEENNYLKIIERNGKHLLGLINDILDLSKIEAGKMEVMPVEVSITSILSNIKDSMTSLAKDKDIELKLNIPEKSPIIKTDKSMLYQVLLNIVGNAIKFTKKGNVNISVKKENKNIHIEVKDTGIGISEEMLPFIFDEFRQVDGSSSREFEGTGLGLTIAKKMINAIRGDISVKSKINQGSVFTITIPVEWNLDTETVNEVNLEHNLPINSNNTISIIDDNSEDAKNNTKKRILLVEDNEDTIIQEKAILQKENYIVDVATGGKEALEYVKHTIPDGIILDLMMPDIDGFKVLENIRKTEKTKEIPILILTAKDLTTRDLSRLNDNKIQQLIHKGAVNIKDLLLKVKLMLANQADLKSETKTVNLKHESVSIKPNILVIEDNPDNMTTIKAILKNKYNIIEASDGEKGLELAQSTVPDIILLDMSLPKMDGEEVIKNIRGNNTTKNISIIAVTARTMKGDKEKILNLGCDDFVPKPINPYELTKKISNFLKK